MALNINRDKFQERSDDIRKYMAKLHSATKEGTSPSNKEIVFVLDFLYDRDLSTWLHLVAVITWGVCTIISYFQLLETLESPKIGKS